MSNWKKKACPVKPTRKPDTTLLGWEFWFEEMLVSRDTWWGAHALRREESYDGYALYWTMNSKPIEGELHKLLERAYQRRQRDSFKKTFPSIPLERIENIKPIKDGCIVTLHAITKRCSNCKDYSCGKVGFVNCWNPDKT